MSFVDKFFGPRVHDAADAAVDRVITPLVQEMYEAHDLLRERLRDDPAAQERLGKALERAVGSETETALGRVLEARSGSVPAAIDKLVPENVRPLPPILVRA